LCKQHHIKGAEKIPLERNYFFKFYFNFISLTGKMDYTILREKHMKVTKIYCQQEDGIYKSDIHHQGTTNFHCIHQQCKSRGKIKDNVFFRTNQETHQHDHSYSTQAEFELAMSKFKQLASTETKPLREIHSEITETLVLEATGLFDWRHTRHTAQMIRRRFMPSCKNLYELVDFLESNDFVQQKFGKFRETQFYQGTVNRSFLVFSNLIMVKQISSEFRLSMDSTFKITPFHAMQLLIFMAEIKGKPRTFAYIIMTRRKTTDYVGVLEHIRDGHFVKV
jgi:hypothetical protein